MLILDAYVLHRTHEEEMGAPFEENDLRRGDHSLQVSEHLQAIAKPCGIEKQQRYLRSTPEVVVATPGRLWELMRDGAAHLTDMSHLSFLVLDEADRMVQQGHYEVASLYQIPFLREKGRLLSN